LQQSNGNSEPTYLALDLGSNSFHLVLATFREGKMVRLDQRKETVRLASGLDSEGRLSEEAQERALQALRGFSSLVVDLPPSRVRAVGTNTLRVAKNASRFLRRAEEALGHRIDIISGNEEARLIYLGVSKDLATGDGQRVVIDIGGGSTEVVLGDTKPLWLESLYMGCVSYSRRFFPDGRLKTSAYGKAVRAARRELLGLSGKLGYAIPDEVVGSSGTIRALGSILNAQGQQDITLAGLVGIRDAILRFESTEEIDIPGLSEDRAPVIVGGLAILEALFRELNIAHMQVSEYAVREGIIHDLAGRFHHRDKRQETLEGMMKNYQVDINQAQRVGSIATGLWQQISLDPQSGDCEMLRWAANLHEIGLALSHAGYHKHGAYILQNADMPGFSRQEQQLLGFLVLNHRRKFRGIDANYGFNPDWGLVLCLRLACIFSRSRRDNLPPRLVLSIVNAVRFELEVDEKWLEENPLVRDDLKTEAKYWKRLDGKFKLRTIPKSRDGVGHG
jgi:exopolyphosphatase/guanosine-5'-triphosphate,3'-diphosphate pyrophosphatase